MMAHWECGLACKEETPAVITKQTQNNRAQGRLKHREERRKTGIPGGTHRTNGQLLVEVLSAV